VNPPILARPGCSLRGRGVWTEQRGSVSAELVVTVPVLLLMLMLIAQFALWAHATHIAQAAASQALAAARVHGASAAEGEATARDVLAQLGSGPLHDPHLTITRGPRQCTVEITGDTVSVVPLLVLPVRARAAGPTERVVAPTAGTE
jgi:TadE-like protein